MLIIVLITLVGIAGTCCIVLRVQYLRGMRFFQHLCGLRQNSLEYYRHQLRDHTASQLQLSKEVDVITQGVRKLVRKCQELQNNQTQNRIIELSRVNSINAVLAEEISRLLEQNATLEERVSALQTENTDIEQLMIENFELRSEIGELTREIKKLRERLEELETAINLETITWQNQLEEQGKLYTAINDIRRSLTRILNPA